MIEMSTVDRVEKKDNKCQHVYFVKQYADAVIFDMEMTSLMHIFQKFYQIAITLVLQQKNGGI